MSVSGTAVSAWSPLHSRDFVLYQVARLLLTVGVQMQGTAMAWYVYDLTHRPLDLGLVGLAQFLPAVSLALVTGHAADRFERQRILLWCFGALSLCAALFFALARSGSHSLAPVYVVLALVGTARAFAGPAAQSFLPHLVPEGHLARGVAYGASVFQVAQIAGPALGGVLYGLAGRATPVFGASTAFILVSAACIAAVRARTGRMEARAASWPLLVEGIRYVWRQKVILGSISMDLFAVLLGGAVALLPIYARDILHTGPWGLGVLRSAPAVGAGAMAILLGTRPLRRRAGPLMLGCVALFGAGTIVFGLSQSVWLSVMSLAVIGAADMVGVVVRITLVQLGTPPAMRGRVSAVNSVFIGASNELGEFESGVTAAWLGAVPAVVVGGIGTLVVVGLWSVLFPELRRIDRLEDITPPEAVSSSG
ncbi:MAG TPA: MFS transporter [Myxococcaceae bacterium]|jgi:MFS family permease